MADSFPERTTTPRALTARYQRAFALCSHQERAADLVLARQLLLECVQGDPTNLIFVDTFLQVLQRVEPRQGRFQGFWDRMAFERGYRSGNWGQMVQRGLRLLMVRPTDGLVLCGLGLSMQELGHRDVALRYWRAADITYPDSPVIQRRCARAFKQMGLFDESRLCWQRLSELTPNAEAVREARCLQPMLLKSPTPQTTATPGHDDLGHDDLGHDELGHDDLGHDELGQDELSFGGQATLAQSDRLCQAGDVSAAITLLSRALQASPGDLRMAEKLEDLELEVVKHRLHIARQQARSTESSPTLPPSATAPPASETRPTQEHQLVAELHADLVRRKIGVYGTRAARYPETHSWKLKLAQSLKQAGNFSAACHTLSEIPAGAVPAVEVHLLWGECLQYERQFEQALTQYETAIGGISSDWAPDQLEQLALYRAGVLALQLGSVAKACRYLQALENACPTYKDTRQHLDKIASIRHKEGFFQDTDT